MPLSEHVSRLGLDLIPSLRDPQRCCDHRGRCPSDHKVQAAFDGLRTTDADHSSFTSLHKTSGPPADADDRLAWSGPFSLVAGTGGRGTCPTLTSLELIWQTT